LRREWRPIAHHRQEESIGGLDAERQSVELHLAFGHIGDGHGHFSESEKWSAGTAHFLLPYARAALAKEEGGR
jgi:hypothetical protein